MTKLKCNRCSYTTTSEHEMRRHISSAHSGANYSTFCDSSSTSFLVVDVSDYSSSPSSDTFSGGGGDFGGGGASGGFD